MQFVVNVNSMFPYGHGCAPSHSPCSLHLKGTVGIGVAAFHAVQMKVMPHAAVPREHDGKQRAREVKGMCSTHAIHYEGYFDDTNVQSGAA